jgi:hypothetical protein
MNGIKALAFLAERGVEVTLLNETEFTVGGFYKSDTVKVNIETNTITARYNEVTTVDADSNLVETLILLNKNWQRRSPDRFGGWAEMDSRWANASFDYQN